MESNDDDLSENVLAELYTFTQIIEVGTENLTSESETKKVESHIHGYIQNALNDHLSKDGDVQIPFYDARLNIETEANTQKRIYTINFHILSVEFWTDDVKAKLTDSYLKNLLDNFTSAKLVSERVVKLLKTFKRDPTSYDDLTKDEVPGCSNIPGVHHWESMHMYFMMKRKDTVSTIKHICFVILSVLLFPILSVAVAWFSWPHLIGTEVIYIMAGIGYRPQFFENYFRIVEKVELFGNPIIHTFPTNHKDISIKLPAHVNAMKKTRIISENASDGEILASIATLKLASMYLRRRVRESNVKKRNTHKNAVNELPVTAQVNDECKHLDVLLAARKGFIGKCNKSK